MRILNRPMFRLGGSTGQGITSGLTPRKKYALGSIDWDEVTAGRDKLMKSYGPPPRGYGVYDFLTDWGLRMASATPSGNVLQTGAKQAIEPHQKLMAGKGEQEMADYMAGVSATGASLSAVADVAAAQAKAREFNKDFTKERRKETMQQDIFTKAQPGTFGSTWSGAAGMAEGTVEINDLKKLFGDQNLPVDLITMTDTEGTGNFTFDPKALDDQTVWWDPHKKQYMIIITTTDAEGKEGVATEYFGNSQSDFERALKSLGKTTTSEKPKHLIPPPVEEKSIWKKLTEGKTTEEEMKQAGKEATEKIKSRFTAEGDITQGDVRGYDVNLKNIVKNEQKKTEVQQDYSQLYKWWEDNVSNFASDYQKWSGQGVN